MLGFLTFGKITSWIAVGIAIVSIYLANDIIRKRYEKQLKILVGGTTIGCFLLILIGLMIL